MTGSYKHELEHRRPHKPMGPNHGYTAKSPGNLAVF
jgi:hypothetical protein